MKSEWRKGIIPLTPHLYSLRFLVTRSFRTRSLEVGSRGNIPWRTVWRKDRASH